MSNDEELRALCLTVLQAKTHEAVEESLRALRRALNEHFLETENLGIHLLLKMGKEIPIVVEASRDKKDGTEG